MSNQACCDSCDGVGAIAGLTLTRCEACAGTGRIDVTPDGERLFRDRKTKAKQSNLFDVPEGAKCAGKTSVT